MTDPDLRYAGGCTDWSRFDVPALAGILNEDLSSSWAQVSAWWQAHDLTREHLAVMRQARETIVRVWPPQTNQAAAVYLDQLDALIASMDNMRAAAEANGRALAGILTVLDNTRETVDDLHGRWPRQQESWWSEVGTVASAATGNPVGLADVSVALASSDEKARLNAQAQATMHAADQAVYEYLPQLVVPQPVIPPPGDEVKPVTTAGDGRGSSSGRGAFRAPTIPPAAPPGSNSVDGAPTLTGDGSPSQGGPSGMGLPGLGQPAPGTDTVPGVDRMAPGSAWVQTPVGRALRSGAVIGAPTDLIEPGAGGAAGRTSSDARDLSRPVASEAGLEGGLLGGGMGAGRPAGRRLRRTMPPDTEWPVRQGVPTVLEPPPDREIRHDSGPGVIGIDR
jgi:hypothetical protein